MYFALLACGDRLHAPDTPAIAKTAASQSIRREDNVIPILPLFLFVLLPLHNLRIPAHGQPNALH
jgi:hypothetical protein